MLRIRFSRTGKVGQPSYRIVVAEHRAPVKGRYIENLGHYLPARNPKTAVINKDRVTHWISKGALPTDSVAALLKKEGFANMEKYLEPRDKQKKKKGEEAKAETKPAATPPPAAEKSEKAAAPAA
ncbi:30S ribosomal protein S16 [Candidatus Peregrinibacteria bacterium]|nr:30S ribosomal protein S16 [Candidatus Peregrinibacteria bacterium]